MKRAAVILAGGAGTRLYPLSSEDNPKQFLKLFDGKSLLEKTYDRVRRYDAVFISTNEKYAEKCREQLPNVPIITEPARRNTAPAIALCTFAVDQQLGESVVAFLPSDHYIGNESEF